MRAAVIEDPPGVRLRERPRPVARSGQVVVAVERVGICGSDVPMVTGEREVQLPHVPGHEFAGRIDDVGPGVSVVEPGDRVTARIARGCGVCPYCEAGTPRLCTDIEEVGVTRDGAYAEYVAVDAETVHALPRDLSFAQGASVDPVASAYHALNRAGVAPGVDVVVIGPGPIGLYAVQLARAEGAETVVMLGTRESRNRLAREVGADETVNVREEDVSGRISAILGSEGSDAVVEATGNPDAIPMAVDVTRKGATIAIAGIHMRPLSEFDIDRVVRGERVLEGSFLYSEAEFDRSISYLADGAIVSEPVITHTLALAEIQDAFDMLRDREAVKIQLDPTVDG